MPLEMHALDEPGAPHRGEDSSWQPAGDHGTMRLLTPRMSMAAAAAHGHQRGFLTGEEPRAGQAGEQTVFSGSPHASDVAPNLLPAAAVGEQLHRQQLASLPAAEDGWGRGTEVPSAPAHVDQRRMTSPVFQSPRHEVQPTAVPAAQAERRATQLPSTPVVQHRMSTHVPLQDFAPERAAVGLDVASPSSGSVDQRRLTAPPSLLQPRQSFAFGEPLRSIAEQPAHGPQAPAHHSLSAAAALERRSTSAPDLAKQPSFGFSTAPVVQQQQPTPAPSLQGLRRTSSATADLMRPTQRTSSMQEPLQPATPRMPRDAHSTPEQATPGQATPTSVRREQAGRVQWPQPPAPQAVGDAARQPTERAVVGEGLPWEQRGCDADHNWSTIAD